MEASPSPAAPLRCADCDAPFASRNLLFKHLKDPAVACGDADQKVVPKPKRGVICRAAHEALTPEQKEALREKNRLKQARAEARKLNEIPLPQTPEELAKELWVGGLVSSVASTKGLRNVLWLAAGTEMSSKPLPVVRMLKKRGYRQDGQWVAYAFVVARSAEEAAQWRAAIDLKQLTVDGTTLTLKARPAAFKTTRRDGTERVARADARRAPAGADGADGAARSLLAGRQPPESEIFLAWPIAVLEERAAACGATIEALAQQSAEGAAPAAYACAEGVRVPAALVRRLRVALERTLWPPQPMRSQVDSEHYLTVSPPPPP